jgi:hypothetical protein
MTKTDRELIEQAESLHIGAKAPEVRMYLGVNKSSFPINKRASQVDREWPRTNAIQFEPQMNADLRG